MKRMSAVVLVLLSACRPLAGEGARYPAPDFTLRDLQGRDVRLSDYLGRRAVVLDFWATWCGPCEAMLPHMEAMYQQHHGEGLQVLGIAMDDSQTAAQVGPMVQLYHLSFPVLLDEETRAVQLYNPRRTAPFQVLIARSGRVFKERRGYSSGDETLLDADVAELLALDR